MMHGHEKSGLVSRTKGGRAGRAVTGWKIFKSEQLGKRKGSPKEKLPDFWQSPLDSAKSHPKSICRSGARRRRCRARKHRVWGANMITALADPFNTLLDLQRALEGRTTSDWLSN